MHKYASMVAAGLFALALAACGGGDKLSAAGSTGSTGTSGGTTGTGTGTGTGSTSTTYSMGNGSGSAFQAGVIGLSTKTLSAGGSASLSVTVVDQSGTLYTVAPTTVTFSSTCLGSGLASITPTGVSTAGSTPNSVTSTTGSITATYTAKGCSGDDVITASANVSSQSLTATGTITVAAGTIGSIQFVSATPTTIGLKGTGLNEHSTVIFKVVDSTGAPRPGATVSFKLTPTGGNISLSPSSGTTGADGTVQTVVSSGTQHGSVVVNASITDPALSTQSGALTVTTGLPASNTFSISVGSANYGSGVILVTNPAPACPNVEAANINQVRVPVTVSLADRYKNPAPDGTAVAFTTNAGKIVGSCNAGDSSATPGSGECVVQWSSEDPRPSPATAPPAKIQNRGWILATATGEEAYDDVNGNGFYDQGEPFTNLGEPYRDDNENGQYDSGEYFLDFNHNQLRDGPTGTFRGITCTGNDANATCSNTQLAIGTSHVIIMSTSGAQISLVGATGTGVTIDAGGTIHVAAGAPFAVLFNIQDLSGTLNSTTHLLENGNPIPSGSSIAVSGTGVTLNGTTSFKEGCSANIGGDTYQVNAVGPTGNGSITITTTAEATQTLSSGVIQVAN